MKIRVKQEGNKSSRGKKAMQFTTATVTVESVEADREALSFTGPYSSDLGSGRSRCWLTDGEDFVLIKSRWTNDQIQALATLQKPKSPVANSRDTAGNSALENKAMIKFDQFASTKWDLVTYGPEYVFCALDAGAVEVLIVTEALLKKQNKQRQADIGNPSKKFRGADVIVVQSGSPHFDKITEYGGALAILRYSFNPEACF
jgi:stalled ribosome rescue protein Dom34